MSIEMTETPQLLIVDDEPLMVEIIGDILYDEGYSVISAQNGQDGIIKAYENRIDLILMDINMPDMDGYEACRILKNADKTRNIPIIFLTGLKDRDSRIKGLEAGGNDFLTKPIDQAELELRIRNMLSLRAYWRMLREYNVILEEEVNKKTSQLRETLEKLNTANRKIKEGYIDTIYRLSLAAEFKDPDTANHLLRISKLSSFFAKQIGLSKRLVEDIFFASPMHDIGKIGIDKMILLKPSSLSKTEFEIIKQHPRIGAEIIRNVHPLKGVVPYVLYHHERYDGTGYLEGLSGEEIPLGARIISISDVFQALTSDRPYRKSLPIKDAFKIIKTYSGKYFDPKVVKAFFEVYSDPQ